MKEFSFSLCSITEGAAHIETPDMSQYRVPTEAPVFYNALMEMNRDVAVLVLNAYQQLRETPLSIMLPLEATGVRGIRFQLEVPNIGKLIMNDVSPAAYALMKRNVESNQLAERIEIKNDDALNVLNDYARRGQRFDVIDLDPFGSPSRFLDAAVRALKMDSGLICLTATDMAPLCGVRQDACLRKYGGRSLRTEYCHELAVRVCLNTLVTTAARYEIAIEPVLCYSIDHYIRLYARLQSGALKADAALQQQGYIVHCFQCNFRMPTQNLLAVHPNCPDCGAPLDYAGPLWLGPFVDVAFCEKLVPIAPQLHLKTEKRILKLLHLILEEAKGPLTYQNIHRICDQSKQSAPPMAKILQALHDAGHFASRTHFSPVSIRTSAPRPEVLKIIQQFNGLT
ncbi:MAG: tRNA (guanine(10)-N(2))-dimethyltransferase [Candidatus Helarchaeota archaeon]|nr:tRNA (guanine(10)-N(2))-dimethyltransferase [Candidatus Helarchaeota archaeon]